MCRPKVKVQAPPDIPPPAVPPTPMGTPGGILSRPLAAGVSEGIAGVIRRRQGKKGMLIPMGPS